MLALWTAVFLGWSALGVGAQEEPSRRTPSRQERTPAQVSPAERRRQIEERLRFRQQPPSPTPSAAPAELQERERLLQRLQQAQQTQPSARPATVGSQGLGTPIELLPEGEGPARPGEGQKLRLDLKGLDILEVFKIFSKQTGLNIVAGPNVRGNVTLYLEGVDLWEAFEAVLESNNLAYAQKGKVIQVLTAADYERIYGIKPGAKRRMEVVRLDHLKPAAASQILDALRTREGQILPSEAGNALVMVDTPRGIAAMKQALEALDVPSESRVFALNYAKVEAVVEKIVPLIDPLHGSLQADARTNRLLVAGSAQSLEEIGRIVQAFDVPHKEVLIEARIVQVSLDDNYQFGVNWNFVFDSINGRTARGSILGTLQIQPTGTQGVNDAKAKGMTATIGTIPPDEFSFTLNLLKTVGDANLLSSPRITALNGQEASILVGTREPFVTTTVLTPGGGGVTTTSEQVTFVDVGVKLFVTPTIGEDGFVTMKIRPEVSSVQGTLTTSQKNSIPIVRTSQAETSLMVKDGVTLVIGGLIEDRKEKAVNRVPILGRIPILGWLFRSESQSLRKSELVIFLTPRIISGALPAKEGRSL